MLSKKGLIELAKSFGRFIYFGVLGLVAVFLASLAADPDLLAAKLTVAGMELPVGVYVVAGVGFVAKAIDRYVRESDKNDKNGIAPKFLQK